MNGRATKVESGEVRTKTVAVVDTHDGRTVQRGGDRTTVAMMTPLIVVTMGMGIHQMMIPQTMSTRVTDLVVAGQEVVGLTKTSCRKSTMEKGIIETSANSFRCAHKSICGTVK